MSSETLRNKCAACYKQYNKKEHLVEHMKISYHSFHEPKCGACFKHCRSFESLREHLIGPLPKVDCARIFSVRGCNLCLKIFDSSNSLRSHRGRCNSSPKLGVMARMSRLGMKNSMNNMSIDRNSSHVVAISCKMVPIGGIQGEFLNVCLIDEDEKIIFDTFVKPTPRHKTGMDLKQVQRKIEDFLCNGDAIWKIRSVNGKARILVGHDLDHDLHALGVDYPSLLIRDIAKYPPLMKTNKLSNTLKYLTQTYLGHGIQNGVQDTYEECVASMRLYKRMSSQVHKPFGDGNHGNLLLSRKMKDLEKMSPEALLKISCSDFYCWCLDSKV